MNLRMRTKESKLGTVCVCCWKDIENTDDVWYDENDQPMCEECYGNNVGFEDEDAGSICRNEKRKQRI